MSEHLSPAPEDFPVPILLLKDVLTALEVEIFENPVLIENDMFF